MRCVSERCGEQKMSTVTRIRKWRRVLLFSGLLLSVAYVLMNILYNPGSLFDRYQYKLNMMQRLIDSSVNHRQCTIPVLDTFAPEMMKFIHEEPPINCTSAGPDWVECEMNICRIKRSIIEQYGPITCDYSEIVRRDDYGYRFREAVRTSIDYELRSSDFVHAKCWSESWTSWTGILYGLREQQPSAAPPSTDGETPGRFTPSRNGEPEVGRPSRPPLNILMLGFDSLSKNAFIRKLPRSYAFLRDVLMADVLDGYNIIGDGTPQALFPLLTGMIELELPEARRRMPDSQTIDRFPFIWKQYQRHGYVTAFNEDIPDYGTFTYRLNGFAEQPTMHYMRTYYMAINPEIASQPRLCIGQHPRHQVMFNYTRQFMRAYPDRGHFVFSFGGELSHDSINLVGLADADLLQWLVGMHADGMLANTVLIVMADHGNRFASVRDTLQGKIEERLPFFSFTFPEWFRREYSGEYETFQLNRKRLVTPFDVHATLEHLLQLQNLPAVSHSIVPDDDPAIRQPQPTRAISLLEPIPAERTCADAFIEPHWCVCHSWQPIRDLSSDVVVEAARSVVDAINRYTLEFASKCARLHLHTVTWAAQLAPSDNLLRFKKTNDNDGFLAHLEGNGYEPVTSSEMYQVKFITRPGDSIFEASVQFNERDKHFSVDLAHVSRVNKYGSQANCIYDVNPELRKYCYCLVQNANE